jgi:hypothetical protein
MHEKFYMRRNFKNRLKLRLFEKITNLTSQNFLKKLLLTFAVLCTTHPMHNPPNAQPLPHKHNTKHKNNTQHKHLGSRVGKGGRKTDN